jgi:hypothetical protein
MAKKTEKPKTWKKKIGEVGVDSGQLMIMDPCYVKGQWRDDDEIIGVRFWGKDEERVREILQEEPYNRTCKDLGDVWMVEASSSKQADDIEMEIMKIMMEKCWLVIHCPWTHNTYDTCCELTGSDDRGGQLNYKLGHAGLGVAFSSGFGDGRYDVVATYRDFGEMGVRIAKVEILLADDEGEELMEQLMLKNCGCSCGCSHDHEEVPEA